MIQTQTINIEHVRAVLLNCPHYDAIVNYDYLYDDNMTRRLIDWYREFIFSVDASNNNQLMLIRLIDNSLFFYISDSKYRKKLNKSLKLEDLSFDNKEIVKIVIKKLIETTNNYENEMVLEVSSSKWL